MMLTCICGGVFEQMFRIPLFVYNVGIWNEGVLGFVLLMSTVGWRVLLLVGGYFGVKDLVL
jgi:hypothetical protein